MTHLRKIMVEELQRRNYSEGTIRRYLHTVEDFARHFGKSPDKLGLDHLRTYQAYLLKQRKLSVGSVVNHVAALRFLYVRTLKRPEFRELIPYPRVPKRLPGVLSKEEVTRMIDSERQPVSAHAADGSLRHRHAPREAAHLKLGDIDSQRMIIRVVNGKGGKDRDLPLSPALLETLRAHWRWLKPRTCLFPSRTRLDSSSPSPTRPSGWHAPKRPTRRHPQARHSAYAAPQLGHASARSRYRPAHHPAAARSRRPGDHGEISAPVAAKHLQQVPTRSKTSTSPVSSTAASAPSPPKP